MASGMEMEVSSPEEVSHLSTSCGGSRDPTLVFEPSWETGLLVKTELHLRARRTDGGVGACIEE
jgi:hypothetical protein